MPFMFEVVVTDAVIIKTQFSSAFHHPEIDGAFVPVYLPGNKPHVFF